MKILQLIAATLVAALLTGCGDPNHPVQTATEVSDSPAGGAHPGSTQSTNSVQASQSVTAQGAQTATNSPQNHTGTSH